jgi:small subunit ribosomal protein S18
MARNNDRDRGTRRAPKENIRRGKKKVCIFCKEHIAWVDYKDVNLLRKFMSDRGKIRARRVSGNCAQHQRDVALAIKTARELAMLPYTQRTTSDRPGPRGGGRGGRPPADERGAPDEAILDIDFEVPEDLVAGDDVVADDDLGPSEEEFVVAGAEEEA